MRPCGFCLLPMPPFCWLVCALEAERRKGRAAKGGFVPEGEMGNSPN